MHDRPTPMFANEVTMAHALRLVETPPRYPPFIGGVENVCQAVCSRLAAHGDTIVVVCADEPRHASDIGDGVTIRRLFWPCKVANTNITPGLPFELGRLDWDVIVTHLPTPWSADLSVLVARMLGRASVLCVHNDILGRGFASLLAWLYRKTVLPVTLRLADRIVVLSPSWRDSLGAIDRSIEPRIRISPNGVDLERFAYAPHDGGHNILFVGVLDQFHRFKGLETLLQAVARGTTTLELTVVGDGHLRAEYETLAETLGIEERVHFMGALDSRSDALVNSYRDADVFVLPSTATGHEGLPLSALEAMASGLPVILSDGVGDLARYAEAWGAAVRVPADNVEALADAIARVSTDLNMQRSMGRAAREYVEEHHSWDSITIQRRSIYIEALNQAALRRHRWRRACAHLFKRRVSRNL